MPSLISVLEIFTQPNDLYLMVFQPKGQSKWGIVIGRGKGHNYKLIVSNGLDQEPHYEDREKAVDGLIDTLKGWIKAATEELEKGDSLAAKIVNVDQLKGDEMRTVLKDEDIEEARERFKLSDIVDTSEEPFSRFEDQAA